MTHKRDASRKYMMPTTFGPMSGPRQTPDGGRYIHQSPATRTRVHLQFLSDAEKIASLLPEGLQLNGEPVVTLEINMIKNIRWLAGRGYNVFGVRVPVRFDGQRDRVKGPFVLVLWESLADPILTGREQLGYPKIYADIPDPVIDGNTATCGASWCGFRFFDMKVTAPTQLSPEGVSALNKKMAGNDGIIVHKYIPHTGGNWDEADADYFTMTPIPSEAQRLANPPLPPPTVRQGTGSFRFHEATWEDLPTQFHIVNALKDLPVVESRDAFLIEEVDNTDFHDQTVLV